MEILAWKRSGRFAWPWIFPLHVCWSRRRKKTQVIRRGEGTKVVAEQAHYQAILLAACPPGARRDIYLLLTQPGADRISHPHPPGSVEHIIVTQGKALVGLTEAPEELGEGDYICYPADQEHIFKALEADTQAILVAEQN
ncbi:DNA binding protein [Citrobacter koseri]|nr:DNA binding protein [Citrobacter koseri]